MSIADWWSLGTLLSIAALLHLLPRLSRPEIFFGVTVPRDFRDSAEGRRLIRIYRLILWGVVAVVGVRAGAGRGHGLVVLGGFLAWYAAHRMARRHAVQPSSVREASLTNPAPKVPGNWLVNLGPFLILGGVAVYLYQTYAALPDPYPVHWNLQGVADRFAPKTARIVFRLPAVGLAICTAMALSAYSIARHSKRISAGGAAEAQETSFRRMNLRLLLGAQYYIAILLGWVTIAYRISSAMPLAHYVLITVAILPLPLAIYLSVRYGQGGTRLAESPTATLGLTGSSALAGDRTSDAHWRLGMIYYNPDDAAIWVEKRFGVGYTVNFARPLAWAILLAMLAGPLLAIVAMRA